MFTGLIEEVGAVVAVRARDHGTELQIAAPVKIPQHVNPGGEHRRKWLLFDGNFVPRRLLKLRPSQGNNRSH